MACEPIRQMVNEMGERLHKGWQVQQLPDLMPPLTCHSLEEMCNWVLTQWRV